MADLQPVVVIANVGGATLDNEENYLIKKLLTGRRSRCRWLAKLEAETPAGKPAKRTLGLLLPRLLARADDPLDDPAEAAARDGARRVALDLRHLAVLHVAKTRGAW